MREQAKTDQAKRLRKALTRPEIWLWAMLKRQHRSGPVFRRQYATGPYIIDFYCVKARLAVEVDGAHHSEDSQIAYDKERDAWLAQRGVATCRISAADLFSDPDDVASGVIRLATERMAELCFPLPSASPPPSP